MKSKLPTCLATAAASLVTTTSSAPSLFASSILLAEVVNCTTCAPNECANFNPMCPKPPNPTTPTLLPLPTFQCRSGDYVVIPAHNNGATAAGFSFVEMVCTNLSSATMLLEYPPYVGLST